MKSIVTGGAGFIGSHVADALLNDGHEVHILDNLSTGRRDNVPEQAVLHVHDIRSKDAAHLIEAGEFDVLVHHAAQMDVRASVRDPRYDADVNIGGFLNLLEAGRKSGLKKVIFASTGGAIYGEPEYVPQDEDHPQRPLSPYGITKLSAEKYLHFYKHQHDLDFVALRYANVYGPRQNPHGDAGVVAIFTREMLENGDPVVNGSGEQTRDYVFVQDVVRANLGALNYSGCGIFNVGPGGKQASISCSIRSEILQMPRSNEATVRQNRASNSEAYWAMTGSSKSLGGSRPWTSTRVLHARFAGSARATGSLHSIRCLIG
jgi:UDP-glucose 4-epimerase